MIQEASNTDERDPPKDFYIKDYELKVRFFTDQLGRMWQRFNYFLVLETALFGGKIYTEADLEFRIGFAVLGFFVSVIWYIMGSEDRYLVKVYRQSVKDAFSRVRKKISIKKPYYSAVEIDSYEGKMETENAKNNWLNKMFNGWRIEEISTTRLAAIIPFLLMLVWLGMLLWHLTQNPSTI